MSTAVKFAPHYTVEDYRLWKGDWELWEGIAIAMTPSPSGLHQSVLAALLTAIRVTIDQQKCQATALSELDWIISHDTVVRPDLIVICGSAPRLHLETPPAMIAEVLSPSTRQNDLTYKRQLYANQGVATYLIVDPDARRIEHLALLPSGGYESVVPAGHLQVTVCGCELEIHPERVFAG